MVATLEMKYRSETILEVIRGLVFNFALYFVIVLQIDIYLRW